MSYGLRHAPRWDTGANQFGDEVIALKWPLIAWLEAAVGRNVDTEGLPTGASIRGNHVGREDEVTKYKLLPHDPLQSVNRLLPAQANTLAQHAMHNLQQ